MSGFRYASCDLANCARYSTLNFSGSRSSSMANDSSCSGGSSRGLPIAGTYWPSVNSSHDGACMQNMSGCFELPSSSRSKAFLNSL